MLLSLVMLLYRASRPYIAILGKRPNGEYSDSDRHQDAQRIPGLRLRLDAPLYFFNANVARTPILAQILDDPPQAILLDLGASADIDIGASDMRQALSSDPHDAQIDLRFAQVRGSVRNRMRLTGLLNQVGVEHIYARVDTAMAASQHVLRLLKRCLR